MDAGASGKEHPREAVSKANHCFLTDSRGGYDSILRETYANGSGYVTCNLRSYSGVTQIKVGSSPRWWKANPDERPGIEPTGYVRVRYETRRSVELVK